MVEAPTAPRPKPARRRDAPTFTASWLASRPEKARNRIINGLSADELDQLRHDWLFWARPKQVLPTGPWKYWNIIAGRGFGKTKTGAESVRRWVGEGARQFLLVGATEADVRDTMITGIAAGPDEGLLNAFPRHQRPIYTPSKKLVRFHTGAIAKVFSAEKPDRLRGPQSEKVWCDELCAWDRNRQQKAWDNLEFGNRFGDNPQIINTTTPKPDKLLRALLADKRSHNTFGSTYENEANLAAAFLEGMQKYEGTRIGRQELYAEIFDDVEGALWTRDMIDTWRVFKAPEMARIVVSVDPSTTANTKSDEAGILVVGQGYDKHRYPLADRTMRARPRIWAAAAVKAYYEFQADCIVVEVNQGGLMVKETIETVDAKVPIKMVHATRGKRTRAEPISAEYEKGLWHHVGVLGALEEELATWMPGMDSPNRLDALVWAGHELAGTVSKFGVTII